MLKIAYLWSQVTPYVVGVVNQLAAMDSECLVVYWDNRDIHSKNWVPISECSKIRFIARSSTSAIEIYRNLIEFSPDIIVVSGWMDKGYITAIRAYRKFNSTSRNVCCIDDQWFGSLKQKFGVLYYKFFYKSLFDFMWISGKPQFSYAQHFGYNMNNVIYNLYSGKYHFSDFQRKKVFKKRFIFIGRLVNIKGIMNLVEAYQKVCANSNDIWPLLIIGAGQLKTEIEKLENPNIHLLNYLGPKEIQEILKEGGVGVLPSIVEPWGVVVHEFVQFGLPVILSDRVGASSEFLINGFNGFSFSNNFDPVRELELVLRKMMSLNDNELANFSNLSFELSKRITPVSSALELLSVLNK